METKAGERERRCLEGTSSQGHSKVTGRSGHGQGQRVRITGPAQPS